MTIIFVLFLACWVIQMLAQALLFLGARRIKASAASSFTPSVSVIICARNEEANIRRNLPEWLKQKYPRVEWLLVNDGSHDATAELFDAAARAHASVRVLHLENNVDRQGGKKAALLAGIEAATSDHLLFTDADCRPTSKEWIHEMVQPIQEADVVLGYAPLRGRSLAAAVARYETLQTFLEYRAAAGFGRAFMGVGRNLALRKSALVHFQGYGHASALLSGDDDLLINAIGRKVRVTVQPSRLAQMPSEAPGTWKSYFRQKRRHYSTARYYRYDAKLLLGLAHGSQLGCWLFGLLCLLSKDYAIPAITLLVTRFLLVVLSATRTTSALEGRKALGWYVCADPLLSFCWLLHIPTTLFGKPGQWN